MTENEGQADRAAMNRLVDVLEGELRRFGQTSTESWQFRRALDAYIDFRVGYILSQTIIDGARIMRVGECPSP